MGCNAKAEKSKNARLGLTNSEILEHDAGSFMLTLFFYYGLRCGELLGLKWSDFDGGKLRIRRNVSRHGWTKGQTITTPKTKNSVRDYPIIEAVKPFLESLE